MSSWMMKSPECRDYWNPEGWTYDLTPCWEQEETGRIVSKRRQRGADGMRRGRGRLVKRLVDVKRYRRTKNNQ
jgi:hypothetical protein